jgi:hypothetical protein
MRIIQKILTMLLIIGFFSTDAFAYAYMECGDRKVKWRQDTIMRANTISFPTGNPYTSSLASAVANWNLNPSNFKFLLILGQATGDEIEMGDGQSDIAFADDASLIGENRAVTFWQIDCGNAEIWEADILFNINEPWTASAQKNYITTYGGDYVSFEGVAEHELGHVLGLEHENRTLTIMLTWAQFHTNWDFANPYPGEDASDGAVFLYGLSPSRPQDLGVSHFKWDPGYGFFRTVIFDHEPATEHFWSEMMDLVDGFVSWRDFESEPRFIVYNGQQIWPEFTYENSGSDTQTVQVGFYLSNDCYIHTSDRRIGGAIVTLSRDWVYTKPFPVTLPSDLIVGGDYYLGVIIDDDDSVPEPYRERNATYTAIRIERAYPASLSFNPMYIQSGESTTGTVSLNGAAPPGGQQLLISVNDFPLSVTAPGEVTVPAGSRSVSFNVTTNPVTMIGDGYKKIDVSAYCAPAEHVVYSSFYLKVQEGYHPDEKICDARPELLLCAICLENPNVLPICDDILGITQEDEYTSREEELIIVKPRRVYNRRDDFEAH